MVFTSRTLLCGLVLVVFLTFGGCSSSTTSPTTAKPKPSVPSGSVVGPQDKSSVAEATIKPSLEALRSGEAPVTPASSPLKDVYFGLDRYDLDSEARAVLAGNAQWLKANPSAQVQVEGHCDERGTTEYNLALGAKRAQVAKDFLVSLGIPADRVGTISYGKEVPVCTEHDERCWQQNRRDRFVITGKRPGP